MAGPSNKLIVLVGLMGSGKSTIGPLLADLLDYEWIDSDAVLAEQAGKPVASIFAEDGEASFRHLEAALVQELISSGGPRVLSLGGGAVSNEDTRAALQDCVTIWLRISPIEALGRMSEQGIQRRPLLGDRPLEVLERLSEERDPYHQEVAQIVIEVDGHDKDELVSEILRQLESDIR